MPIYLKKVFADDPIFKEVKIVVSLYGDGFDKPLDAGMKEKIANEGVKDKNCRSSTPLHTKTSAVTLWSMPTASFWLPMR